jgi:putative SOS response-associated peptidase YedK
MCNLYSLTKGQAAIRDWFRARHDRTGNLPLFPGVFPDQTAPTVRAGARVDRELVLARFGMPGPPQYGGAPVNNIRNLTSPHWQGWLGRRNRCLAPATSFREYADTKPRKTPIWFALAEDRPLFAFAGLWASRRGLRGPKSAPVAGRHELFGFLTTEANAIVAPIHSKAMPVILTTPAEFDRWLEADTVDALTLQRPLSDDARCALWPRTRRRTEGPTFSFDPHRYQSAAFEAVAATLPLGSMSFESAWTMSDALTEQWP